MERLTLKHLRNLNEHMVHYNSMAPFPIYDTDYIKDVQIRIKEMEDNKEYDYDQEPVVVCKYCKSLHIVNDEFDNSHCYRCQSINELITFDNIYEYKKHINKEN